MLHKPLHYRGGCFFYDIVEMWCGKVVRITPRYYRTPEVTCPTCQASWLAWWSGLPTERRAAWGKILIKRGAQ